MSSNWTPLQPTTLRLPACPLPRPGEKVCWYVDSRIVYGTFLGHNLKGIPLIVNQFGNPVSTQKFDTIRVADPFERHGPNWQYLPTTAKLSRPPDTILSAFKDLLDRRIPPGPRYADLVNEIWSRGFEVFIVGGTVRDVLIGKPSKDIDIVTTMPLSHLRPLVRSMFRYDPSTKDNRGYMRIGGSPESGDPFIDLKVFSDSLPGTSDATFGVGFERDVGHRDFACNAIYFDPVNGALVDPTGCGVEDALKNRLTLICNCKDPHQNAQLFVRFFKFRIRGFIADEVTLKRICSELVLDVPAMKAFTRAHYVKSQLLSKCDSENEHNDILTSMREQMIACGVGDIWDKHFAPAIQMHLK